jgi:hypothetical protein
MSGLWIVVQVLVAQAVFVALIALLVCLVFGWVP